MKLSTPRYRLGLATLLFFIIATTPTNVQAQTESLIYSFPGGDNGSVPTSGLTFHNGSVFGVTNEGGAFGDSGILFELSPDGNGGWTENVLHVFEGGNDGATPSSPVFDPAGNFYGAATSYGANGCGLIFEFSPVGSGWNMQELYNFKCGSDGTYPSGGLAIDPAGNLYGATGAGGDLSLCQSEPWNLGCGVIFKLSPGPNGIWTQSVLYTFTGQADGWDPWAALTLDPNGNLYGTTPYYQGKNGVGYGILYKLSPQPNGTWKYSVLHAFPGGAGGQLPFSNLILSGGNIYGTTWQGGLMQACNGSGCGVAYRFSPATKKFTVLHTFTGGPDGGNLFSPLTLAGGKLFGTTQIGGDLSLCQGTGGSQGNGCGVVYQLLPTASEVQSAWRLRVVYTFENSNNNDGDGPDGRMTFDSQGNLYGETRIGGTYGLGAIFKITPY